MSELTFDPDIEAARKKVHEGMPPFEHRDPPVSAFEFWPGKLFYAPVAVQWLLLALRHGSLTLPTAANPGLPLGGLVGESKAAIMGHLKGAARERFAAFVAFERSQWGDQEEDLEADILRVRNEAAKAGLSYPFVAKPDMGCRGVGVRLLKSDEDLRAYLAGFPAGGTIIFQRYVPYEAEAGVFYVRFPGEERGRITSLTLKYFPHVFGDGVATLEELILADPRAGRLSHLYLPRHAKRLDWVPRSGEPVRLAFAGSHSRGTIFRNGNAHRTDAMARAFDAVADGIPGFCFGRFDIRFASMEALQRGEDFNILEINGAGGESTHIWDAGTSLFEAYRDLAQQFRMVFEVGAANRRLGHKPSSLAEVYRAWRSEKAVVGNYPPTE